MDQFDVIIVGGGLVGLVLALSLVQQEFRVALVDSQAIESIALDEQRVQARVVAITPVTQRIFENLGVWDDLRVTDRVSPFEQMHVWDSVGRGEIHFDCTQIANPCLGYIIENALIQNVLLKNLATYQNFRLYSSKQPHSLSYTADAQHIELKAQDILLSAKLVVGADGAHSWVRQQTHIKIHTWPYHHSALVTTVNTELSHNKTAWQCFLPDGPLALLPMSDPHVCSIVWSSTKSEVERLQNLETRLFNFEISNAFEQRLGQISKISPDFNFPIVMRHAKEYIKNRVALVGDAAHTIHPLAGQGINLGFLDAAQLSDSLVQNRNLQKDWGEYRNLRAYERIRKTENWLMIAGMEAFKHLFGSESILVAQARSVGLNTVDHLGFLKKLFIYKAAGVNRTEPPLTRRLLM